MFERILVPLDESKLAEGVLPHVKAIARCFDSEIHLLSVQVSENAVDQSYDPLTWSLRVAEKESYLDGVKEQLEQQGFKVIARVVDGRAADAIIRYAEDEEVALIILCSHGQSGLTGWNVSSVVQKVVIRARTSVMVVRAYERPSDVTAIEYCNILMPVDASKRAEYALPAASSLAQSHGAKLHLAFIIKRIKIVDQLPSLPEDQKLADQVTELNRKHAEAYLKNLQSRMDIKPEVHLQISDNVPEALHELVEQAGIDLVVITAHGYSGTPNRLYGSIPLSFLLFGTTPVLVAQDFPRSVIKRSKAEQAAEEKAGH